MIAIPWDKKTVPHCVLEITQRCNLSCKACYRQNLNQFKSVDEILGDLITLENNQQVQTVSVAGGEPTLHPDLIEIVEMIHSRGHKVSLVTNGLKLSDDLLVQLSGAGLDIVMIHVDEGQQRPDLPAKASIEDINKLRTEIAARVSNQGIDAGLCVTIYQEHYGNLKKTIDCVIESKDINFVFATHAADVDDIVQHSSLSGEPIVEGAYRSAPTRNSDIKRFFKKHYSLDTFAYIPPREVDAEEMPCISYFIPVNHTAVEHRILSIKSGKIDEWLIRLSRKLEGRYMYYCKPSAFVVAVQLMVNGLSSFRSFFNAFGFLALSMTPKTSLRAKRLVFENAPVVLSDGTVNCCEFCPNSTARKGKVIPVCLADHLEPLN